MSRSLFIPNTRNGGTHQLYRIFPALAVCVLPLATLLILANGVGAGPVDDTYIFLRYAKNIAAGHGPVFNAGEYVEGFSSPLWTLTLAACAILGLNLETMSCVLGVIASVVCFILMVRSLTTADRQDSRAGISLIMGLTFICSPIVIFWSASGMDTAQFTFLVMAALFSAMKDHAKGDISARTIALLVLATLARMEGVLAATCISVLMLTTGRSIRRIAFYLLALLCLLFLRFAYYDAWVPNTYYAKVSADFWHRVGLGAGYIAGAAKVHLPIILMATGMLIWLARAKKKIEFVWLFPAAWCLLWLAYLLYTAGDNFGMYRLIFPVIPAATLVLGRMVLEVRQNVSALPKRCVVTAVILAALASHILALNSKGASQRRDIELAHSWSRVGHWLDQHSPPNTLIATPVPGALGYFGNRPTIDMLGLTDRVIARQGMVFPGGFHGHARYHTDYLYERDPDLVVYLSSGRFQEPVYANPDAIPLGWAYAMYDFVRDPRCPLRYGYTIERMADGTVIEMQQKKTFALSTAPLAYLNNTR